MKRQLWFYIIFLASLLGFKAYGATTGPTQQELFDQVKEMVGPWGYGGHGGVICRDNLFSSCTPWVTKS